MPLPDPGPGEERYSTDVNIGYYLCYWCNEHVIPPRNSGKANDVRHQGNPGRGAERSFQKVEIKRGNIT